MLTNLKCYGSGIVALLILCLFSVQVPAEIVPIDSINESHIGKWKTVKGRIVNIIPPNSEKAPYAIYLTDDTETLRVVVWQDVYKKIAIKDQLKPGCEIIVSGKINEYSNNLNLYLNDPRDILPPDSKNIPSKDESAAPPLPAGVLTPGAVDNSQMDETVTIQGQVEQVEPAWNATAPHSIFLQGPDGTLRVVYWSKVADSLDSRIPVPGRWLRIKGEVGEFRGELQLKVDHSKDIELIDSTLPSNGATTKVAVKGKASAASSRSSQENPLVLAPRDIGRDQLGDYVDVKGKIVDFEGSWQPSAPNKVTLSDGTGNILVVYWPDLAQRLKPEQKPQIGKSMRAVGRLDEYRGEIQVKVSSAKNIIPLGNDKPTQKTGLKPMLVSIDSITRDYLDIQVAIKGAITRIAEVNGGRILEVTDSSGSISVPLWDDVAQNCPDEKEISKGAEVLVRGVVDLYERKDEIQIKLLEGQHIKVLKKKPETREKE